jgi:hypothetical protein
MISSRIKFLKWNWVIIMLDYGGVVETFSYNKSDKDFAEINGGLYYFYQAYVKYVLGVPLYIFLANDARSVTTIYEKVTDEKGDYIYDFYLDGKHIKASIGSKNGTGVILGEDGEVIPGATYKHRTRPLAWSHYNNYPPELVSPKNLATGVKINRATNRILAALSAEQSKTLITLIFIGVVIAVIVGVVTAYQVMQDHQAIKLSLAIIQNQTMNLTGVYSNG